MFTYSELNPKSFDFLYKYCLKNIFLCVIPVRSRFAADGIEELCNNIFERARKPLEEDWLFAMPLLHFLRGDSKPFEEPEVEGSYHRSEWFGAQNLKNIEEFRRSATEMYLVTEL